MRGLQNMIQKGWAITLGDNIKLAHNDSAPQNIILVLAERENLQEIADNKRRILRTYKVYKYRVTRLGNLLYAGGNGSVR